MRCDPPSPKYSKPLTAKARDSSRQRRGCTCSIRWPAILAAHLGEAGHVCVSCLQGRKGRMLAGLASAANTQWRLLLWAVAVMKLPQKYT